MNQVISQRILLFVAFAATVLLSPPVVAGEGNLKNRLDGTWMVTVTRVNPPPGLAPTFLAVLTLTSDGRALEESNTTTIRSLGHGEWFRTGPRQFRRSAVNFRFAPPPAPFRTYIGLARISADVQLNEDGDEFIGQSITESFDVDGNLTSTAYGIEEGRRCDSLSTVKQCLGNE